jgi:hypothetical protein
MTTWMMDMLLILASPSGRVEYFPILIGRQNSGYIFSMPWSKYEIYRTARAAKINGEYENGYEYTLDHRGSDILVRRIWLVRTRTMVLR